MNLLKILCSTLVVVLCIIFISGCGSKQGSIRPETVPASTYPAEIVSDLVGDMALSLPDTITKEHVSDTRAYFLADEVVIGGIEILNLAGQRDTQPDADGFRDLAITVTKLVQDGEHDYSVDPYSDLADVTVDIKFRNGRTFIHHFFFGEKVVYDIWVDHDVLDGQDMISILKTLHSEDIVNPQDRAPVNGDVPILNLRTDLPEGIVRMPSTTTRLLFYNIPSLEEYVTGENVAGGVEYIADGADLDTLESVIAALGQEYLGGQYEAKAQACSDANVITKVIAHSSETELISYVVQVDGEVYAIWASTAIISEEDILKIAESCRY